MDKANLLSEICKKCYEISNNSKTDVFFNYSLHCIVYSVNYYLNGWEQDIDAICIAHEYITEESLQKTLKELDNLWQQIMEKGLNKI